jgi:hypothetical protein
VRAGFRGERPRVTGLGGAGGQGRRQGGFLQAEPEVAARPRGKGGGSLEPFIIVVTLSACRGQSRPRRLSSRTRLPPGTWKGVGDLFQDPARARLSELF